MLEGSPSISLGSQQGNSPHWSPPLQVVPSPPRRNGRHPVGIGHLCAEPHLPPSIPPPVKHNPWIKTSYDVRSICWRKINNNGIKTGQSNRWTIPIPSPPSIKTGGLPVCTGLRRAAPPPVYRGHNPPPCGSRRWWRPFLCWRKKKKKMAWMVRRR